MVASRIANLKDGQTARSANWRTSEPAVSQPDAARMLNVSERSAQRAAKIEREAITEVTKAVERGEVAGVVAGCNPQKKGIRNIARNPLVIWQPDSLKTALPASGGVYRTALSARTAPRASMRPWRGRLDVMDGDPLARAHVHVRKCPHARGC